MSFIDYIKNFIGSNKKNARFITTPFAKTFGDPEPLEVALYDGSTPIVNQEIGLQIIGGNTYIKTTDENGIAKLNINLSPGEYTCKCYWKGIKGEYNSVTAYVEIKVLEKPVIMPEAPALDKKQIILGCDSNTSDDNAVQNYIAERLQQEGYPVEKLAIEPNEFASYDWSGKARGKIGVYLIASGLFSIADAWANQGGFDNYIFGIRGDFGDKGATCFDCPIRPDSDCTSICDKFANKTFNEINAMTQPKIAVVGGESTERLADNMIDWLRALENREPETTPAEEEKTYSQEILEYFESKFGKMTCIDDCLEAIQGKGYGYYYDDAYTNYTSINRMANGSGVNCTDSCQVFWHLAVALGYRVEVLHIQCSGGDGHVRLELEREGTGTFYRDPAAVLDGNSINYNWCTSGYTIAVNPDWFFENLYR
jgi:hypothetical protein